MRYKVKSQSDFIVLFLYLPIAVSHKRAYYMGVSERKVPINGETVFFGFLSAVSSVHLSASTWFLSLTGGSVRTFYPTSLETPVSCLVSTPFIYKT